MSLFILLMALTFLVGSGGCKRENVEVLSDLNDFSMRGGFCDGQESLFGRSGKLKCGIENEASSDEMLGVKAVKANGALEVDWIEYIPCFRDLIVEGRMRRKWDEGR